MKSFSVALALLLLTACGDDGDSDFVGSDVTTPTTAAPPTTEAPADDDQPDATVPDLDDFRDDDQPDAGSPGTDEAAEQLFIDDAQDQLGLDAVAAESMMELMRDEVCGRGLSGSPDVADAYLDGFLGDPGPELILALDLATEHLCPQHADLVGDYLADNNLN